MSSHKSVLKLAALLLFAAAMMLVANGARAEGELPLVGQVIIQDGDTFEIGPVLIRLNGVDAPEAGQKCTDASGKTWACGNEATNRLAELTQGYEVSCVGLLRDQYGRIISDCTAGDVNLGKLLVAEGTAWAATRFSDVYVPEQEAAKAARLGIWSGDNQPAWEYRANKWERAVAESPNGCPIKGNISMNTGEKIYHTPWSPWYSRTKINTAKGERWFCDEEEAVLAGWRAARFH